jgi:hypothetical protein
MIDELLQRLESGKEKPRYFPNGLPANYAAIHRIAALKARSQNHD